MSKELVFVIEPDAGRLTVEISNSSRSAIKELEGDLGKGVNVNCGKPTSTENSPTSGSQKVANTTAAEDDQAFTIWLYRVYHRSTVDGPGRRSVVQVSGCSIRCPGCYVPQTHERENGIRVPIASVVDEIVAHRAEHDGVTILGGEPFDQAGPAAELTARLKKHGLHLVIYTGYTLEDLINRKEPNIDYILTHTDLLIDGPFLHQMSQNAGEYRGSRNQRLIVISEAGLKAQDSH